MLIYFRPYSSRRVVPAPNDENNENGENDSVTGSGSNHHQIPLRRYGGGYTAAGHSLLSLLFTLYSLLQRRILVTCAGSCTAEMIRVRLEG